MSGMDTLRAADQLKAAGMPPGQAEAVSRVINDLGRENLVTKEYLDMRLMQFTAAIAALFITVGGAFKLFA
jgi:hypothetical protein